jgi:hypothetical protein
MGIERLIHNAQLVVDFFGEWPAFHDAEVLKVTLLRDIDSPPPWLRDGAASQGPCLEAAIYAFSSSGKVDAAGYYDIIKQSKVTLRFYDVTELFIEDFNGQNVLFALHINETQSGGDGENRLEVEFKTSYGMWSSFQCHSISVESVKPFEPDSLQRRSGPRPVRPGE